VITVVGEILVDLIEHGPGRAVAHPGGSPANVAVALARLGGAVNLMTQLGKDTHGNLLLAHLRDNGVDLAPGSLLDCPRTSSARTLLSPDGEASYTFDITWQRFTAPATAPTVSCVHTGSLAAMLPPGAEDVAALVRAACQTSMVSFDPNCRPALFDDVRKARDRVVAMVATSDIVKVSRDDLGWLYPRRPYQDIAHEWLDHGAGLIVVTLAGGGAWACTPQREKAVDAYPVEVVDTVGAGDAFTAGLLAALSRADLLGVTRRAELGAIDDATLTEVLTFASRVAAVTCGRRGADPPTSADLVTGTGITGMS
jgi:fructokinase